jgi:hypothetical protein
MTLALALSLLTAAAAAPSEPCATVTPERLRQLERTLVTQYRSGDFALDRQRGLSRCDAKDGHAACEIRDPGLMRVRSGDQEAGYVVPLGRTAHVRAGAGRVSCRLEARDRRTP